MRKLICLVILVLTMLSGTQLIVYADSDGAQWYKEYREEQKRIADLKKGLGSYDKARWVYKNGDWYFFGDTGSLETGWFNVRFYFDDKGNMIQDGNTYYSDEKGRMQTGWIQDEFDGKWYYLTESGALLKNAITPDGYTVDENGAWVENEMVSAINRKSPIEIFRIGYSTNSVGGKSPAIYWRNNSGKTIKYIYFDMVPYNAVGDRQICEIRGYSTFTGYVTGPIEQDEEVGKYVLTPEGYIEDVDKDYLGRAYNTTATYEKIPYTQEEIRRTFSQENSWDCAWYNNSIKEIRITAIRIEYMDGSTQSVNPQDVMFSK